MKIVGLYLNSFVRTGGQRRYLELMDAFARRGHRVIMIMNPDLTCEWNTFERIDIAVPSGALIRRLPWVLRYLAAVRRQLAIVKSRLADVHGTLDWIHIHGEAHLWAAEFIRKRIGGKLFFAFRCNSILRRNICGDLEQKGRFLRLLNLIADRKDLYWERLVARKANLICFQSKGDADDYLKHAPKADGKIVVIPGAIDGPRFKNATRDSNTSARLHSLVYVGLVSMSKGLTFLLEALGKLRRSGYEPLPLKVLGRGAMVEQMTDLCARLGIVDSVQFMGQVSDPFPYLAEADLMVYPTLYDAFPDTLLECLHVGIPVIASRIGGIPDILHHDELMFPVKDSDSIAASLRMMIDDVAYYNRIRELCANRRSIWVFDWAGAWERAMETGPGSSGTGT